jgi:hypothetical protein
VNEPAATACRTCGRWPSLFDLDDSTLEDIPPINPRASAPAFDMEPQPDAAGLDTALPSEDDDAPPEIEDPEEGDAPAAPPWRRLLRFAVPVGVALYILISSALNH